MKELLQAIVTEMVNYPDEVNITEVDGDSTIVLELKVAKKDMGIIIGSKGKNITAVRTIMKAAAAKMKKRIIVELVEPEKAENRDKNYG